MDKKKGFTYNKEGRKGSEENDLQYNHLFETMPLGVVYQDPDGVIISANPAAEKILGLSLKQMQGNTSLNPGWKMIREDGSEVSREEHPAMVALRTGRKVGPLVMGLFHPQKNTHVWLRITVVPLFQPGEDRPFQAYSTFEDYSERKKTEEALWESEEKYRLIAENMSDIVWIMGLDLKRTYVSSSVEAVLGFTPEESMQQSLEETVAPGSVNNLVTLFSKEIVNVRDGKYEPGHSIIFEAEYYHKNGSTVWMESNCKPMLDKEGNLVGIYGVSRDVNDRKKVEDALRLQANERAAVDDFTYSVSHDLQAPLRRIEGFSEALLEEYPECLDEQGRDYLRRINEQVGSMKLLTDALLRLSRVVSHRIEKEEIDLSILTRSHLERKRLDDPGRKVEIKIEQSLIAEGDIDLLSIALEELIDNAWKFTSETEKACIELGSLIMEGKTAYYIKDNGTGFNMRHADKLFVPFQKLHNVNDYPGIGIGLNIFYRIITRHEGEVWAESEPGKGAAFYFTLP